MKKISLAILFLLFLIPTVKAQVSKAVTPSWVSEVDYKEAKINKDNVTQGTAILLFDQQVHVPKKIVYYRIVTEVIDNVGIQSASTISTEYDPTYQKLKFHTINIIRDGKIIEKLNPEHFQVIRREMNSENYLYDGSLSAIMNISDVRTGDIIDYSYSISGFNPIHKNKFSSSFYLNDYEPVGFLNVDILTREKIKYKLFNSAKEPTITKSDNLIKYSWRVSNPEQVEFEDNTPSWKIIYDMVLVSNYDSWKEVVDWSVEVFSKQGNLSNELLDKIEEINNAFETQGEKVKATLDFVQNEIRYLGLEYGIGAYQPFPPSKVLEQRFGDCKDKSLLMTTMLNKMNIEAYPMLVNTTLKHTIEEFLPSPKFFDHCVVKVIDKNENEQWFDPTMTNQGGNYYKTYFPDYEYGLVIKKNNFEFDKIEASENNRTETVEEFTLDEIGGGANLKVTSVYYDGDADNMRSYFKMNSLKSIKNDFENFYANYYSKVTSLQTPQIKDNVQENEFRVYEEYQIDSLWTPMENKENFISASFIPSTLSGILYPSSKEERNNEFAIAYPINKYHDIKINLPTTWNVSNDFSMINSAGFYYDWKVDYNKKSNQVEVTHILKTQKNHITNNEILQYQKDLKEVDNNFGFTLYISSDASGMSTIPNLEENIIIGIIKAFFSIGVWVLIIAGVIVFIYLNRKKKEL
ncbi:DUF3857 domain-containing transglutaminase family protein [Flavobacteriaceae bacterium S0825]|uniref:DUF3857 domain-containing transglutaminase family protein n=1 Tax=Gaetbulibacter sp. S0825 TaxID=2720084 RepID=UPI0014308E17|nr:DUF3857 domain-containing transglutaminase family protein [Gaetbulibacter sp. S0825]MCK0109567.1 DUF3857 domain-containing transglutaminase family protein [Flavobacteriaceae bacterium S0825]NIX65200.1 DUF3857 domain-containing transglutaminase family protein [Gaetbulibacter sp. S0825]